MRRNEMLECKVMLVLYCNKEFALPATVVLYTVEKCIYTFSPSAFPILFMAIRTIIPVTYLLMKHKPTCNK